MSERAAIDTDAVSSTFPKRGHARREGGLRGRVLVAVLVVSSELFL